MGATDAQPAASRKGTAIPMRSMHGARCSLASYVLTHMTPDDDVLSAPLSVLGLTLRTSNALLNNGFSTVGDVVD